MGYAAELFTWILVAYNRLGYLDRNKRLRAFLLISVPAITILPGAYNVYYKWADFGEAIYYFFIISALSSTVVRAFSVIINQQKFLDIFKFVEDWYCELEHDDDKRSWEKLQKFTKNARRYSKYVVRTVVISSAFAATQPILTNYGKFVIEIGLPGIDLHQSPMYEVCYLFQAIWMTPVAAISYVAYVNSFLIFMSFGIFMLRDLQQKLESLWGMDEEDALTNMKNCIKYHLKIIKFCDDLEELFSTVCLVNVSLYCIVICMLLVYATKDYDVTLLFRGLQWMLIDTVSIFVTFSLANTFSDESLNIAHAAYGTNWMERGIQFRKCVMLMIARSQRPLQLTAGGFKPLTMEVFLAIMRASYSLFSLLQSTM